MTDFICPPGVLTYRLAFLALKHHADEHGIATLGVKRLGILLGRHHQSAANAIGHLENDGSITTLRRGTSHIRPQYQINVEDVTEPEPLGLTGPQTEKIKELWASGLSETEIGIELKVTKNTVHGKVRRLVRIGALEKRASPIRVPPKSAAVSHQPAPKPKPDLTAGSRAASGRQLSAMAFRGLAGSMSHLPAPVARRKGDCAWPLRCDDPAETGVWCATHAGLLGKKRAA